MCLDEVTRAGHVVVKVNVRHWQGTPEHRGVKWTRVWRCTTTGFSAFNKWRIKWKCAPRTFRWHSGGIFSNQIRREWTHQHFNGHSKMDSKLLFQHSFPVKPLHQMIRCNYWYVLAVVKSLARHIHVVATVPALSALYHVPARVVSTKEQGRPSMQMPTTTMNRQFSPEIRIHTMHISFHLPIPNEPLSRNINCVIPLYTEMRVDALCICTYWLIRLLNTGCFNNIQGKPKFSMLFIFDITTACFNSVFKSVSLEAILCGYHGNSKH